MKKYILAIDAGTTGITILLVNKQGKLEHKVYSEFKQYYPRPGWVEHDPDEIWNVTLELIRNILKKYKANEIESIGITNQRETTIIWDKDSGKPIYNAIVWQCRRTSDYCETLKSQGLGDLFYDKTGLIIDSYFSGTKIKWIFDNVSGVRKKVEKGQLIFGTIDTWLIWNLSGKKYHITDYTNASRTMIFNINKKCWDKDLLEILNIPRSILPEVKSSSSIYCETDKKLQFESIKISGIAGDQQSALFGQNGFSKDNMKCTYGTGCFLLLNTGKKRIKSSYGMLNTLAIDKNGEPSYALEGSVFIAGAVIQWLRDELKIVNDAFETSARALSVNDTAGVYFVPSFTGLGSPYWNMESRGLICGLTRGTNQNHIIRAALEGIAFQVKNVIDGVEKDLNYSLNELLVDGGATKNEFLMQFQSDILRIKINKPENIETTALGVAYLAGLATGFWESYQDLKVMRKIDKIYSPKIEKNETVKIWNGWEDAVKKTILS
tara:strand:- start:39 stop:1517 length:1479 start_codon:yes stop_codon:yes gene_type:complete